MNEPSINQPSSVKQSSSVDQSSGVDAAPKLSEEDMARVSAYLNSPVHRRERAPFRPWLLMVVLMAVVTGLTALSLLYAWYHGASAQ